MSVTVQRDRYDYPICRKCGHPNHSHGGSVCRHLNAGTLAGIEELPPVAIEDDEIRIALRQGTHGFRLELPADVAGVGARPRGSSDVGMRKAH
jgi:hypothetical protein